ncbi:MAG: hypothetical protein M1438_01595 [Deltaproteobacteria bacterium]|nr:hypothetical protein [Deltaproteobacteria bacterium]
MKLVISVDVEEEGLFSGRYPRESGVINVGELRRLEFIPRDFGFPLTLLVSYQVARDPAACAVLARWRDLYGAEIGVHLHPWSTPPFDDLAVPEPVPAAHLPLPLLRDKFARLVQAVQDSLGVEPASFRMGRFDFGPRVLDLLPEFGLKTDSSIAPLTLKGAGDYFLAPADPFWLNPALLEVPLTLVPVVAGLPEVFARLARFCPGTSGHRLLSWFKYWGAAGIQPAWFPLPSMRLAVKLHRRRGGRTLTMFFHSSELKPGASRLFPTEEAVGRFVAKIRTFFDWLVKTGPVEGVTLSGLFQE